MLLLMVCVYSMQCSLGDLTNWSSLLSKKKIWTRKNMVLKKALLNGTEPQENSLSVAWSSWSRSPFSTALPCPGPLQNAVVVCLGFPFWLIIWGTQKNMPFPFCTIICLKATCFPNEISLWRTNYLVWEVENSFLLSHSCSTLVPTTSKNINVYNGSCKCDRSWANTAHNLLKVG